VFEINSRTGSGVSRREDRMKVKVDCTLEIDSKVMKAYIDDMGDGESIKKFVANYIITAGILCLDEGIKNAIDKDHFTGIVRHKFGHKTYLN
jgi:hypothetical protein